MGAAVEEMTDIRKDEDQVQKIIDALRLNGWDVLIDPVQEQLAAVLAQSGKKLLAALEIGDESEVFNLVDAAAVKFAQTRAAELVGKRVLEDGAIVENPDAMWSITTGTRELLRGTVNEALENGWSVGELRQQILDHYAFSAQRALNVARTESARAHGIGGFEAARASGVVRSKSALISSAHPEPDECDENADAGRIPIDEPFPSGTDQAEAQHPACECSTAYSTEEAG